MENLDGDIKATQHNFILKIKGQINFLQSYE